MAKYRLVEIPVPGGNNVFEIQRWNSFFSVWWVYYKDGFRCYFTRKEEAEEMFSKIKGTHKGEPLKVLDTYNS